MKKFFLLLEEVWVAAAFAEEGAYEALSVEKPRTRAQETASLRAV